jgi:hypothetical protein
MKKSGSFGRRVDVSGVALAMPGFLEVVSSGLEVKFDMAVKYSLRGSLWGMLGSTVDDDHITSILVGELGRNVAGKACELALGGPREYLDLRDCGSRGAAAARIAHHVGRHRKRFALCHPILGQELMSCDGAVHRPPGWSDIGVPSREGSLAGTEIYCDHRVEDGVALFDRFVLCHEPVEGLAADGTTVLRLRFGMRVESVVLCPVWDRSSPFYADMVAHSRSVSISGLLGPDDDI